MSLCVEARSPQLLSILFLRGSLTGPHELAAWDPQRLSSSSFPALYRKKSAITLGFRWRPFTHRPSLYPSFYLFKLFLVLSQGRCTLTKCMASQEWSPSSFCTWSKILEQRGCTQTVPTGTLDSSLTPWPGLTDNLWSSKACNHEVLWGWLSNEPRQPWPIRDF